MRYSLCDGWEFTPRRSEAFLAGDGAAASLTVRTDQTEDVTLNFTIEIKEEERWT